MLKAEIEHRNKKQERTTNIMPTNTGEYVKKIRTEQNLTLKELSKKSGLSVSFLSQFERGISTISVDALLVLADALGIDSREVIMESLATSQPKEDYVLRSYNRHIPQISANNQIQTSLSSFGYDKKMLARMYTLLPDGSEEKTLPKVKNSSTFWKGFLHWKSTTSDTISILKIPPIFLLQKSICGITRPIET